MKRFALQITILVVFPFSLLTAQTPKKYDLKSGIITYETTMTMSGMTIKKTHRVYFDDYGMKECKETLDDGGNVKEWFLSDGKDLYQVLFAEKEVYKQGKAVRGTELRFDWNELPEKDRKEGKYKKASNVSVAGKSCEAFESHERNTTTKFAGWNHITLLTDLTSRGMSTVTKAVKIEENANVPAEKFKPPSGFTVK